ncbi:MAG: terminase family protein [Peptostreptococcus sp.]|uniref:terminase large subunit domain-containing protein n=1 Tax=Peptostreptococcus sp. TaxID=1262 RepID=UPI00290ECEC5|nr:terminase family protein [Peptostreptococcus sp.]MDU5350015.1 terminase family protein [Peptostreptococcus sp.]MDU5891505.1 terminase family protein [Peptostreptococcus sp.]
MAKDNKDWEFYTKTKKRRTIHPNKQKAYEKSLSEWVMFWRENPHRFAQDYLGIRLKWFQELILYEFDKKTNSIFIGTRGVGKSFLIALFACCMAILYPNSKIVIVCATKGQAIELINSKIEKELCNMSVMLRKEIKDFESKQDEKTVRFKNGSFITATNASVNRRGKRATILIVDEAVQLDKLILEQVCQPFLNNIPEYSYRRNPKYSNYSEYENKTIYLTSAWLKAHYFYQDYYIPFVKKMANGKDNFVINIPVATSIREGLISESRVEELKEQMDSISYLMETEAVFFGENANAFFNLDEIDKCRRITNVFYPPTSVDWINEKSKQVKSWDIPKVDGEIRVLSADIALQAGAKNDNSIYSLLRLIPKGKTWKKELVCMESYNGLQAEFQALRLKQLFYDFGCDRMIIDAHGIGMTVYNELEKEIYDNERGVTYPAWTSYNKDGDTEFNETDSDGALAIMYAMKATLESNHEMAMKLKSDFMSNKLLLPDNDINAKELLNDTIGLSSLSGEKQAKYLAPFAQTTLLVGELVNLAYDILNGKVKIKEKNTARKDRYSSLAYGNYLCNLIIEEKLKSDKSENQFVFFN